VDRTISLRRTGIVASWFVRSVVGRTFIHDQSESPYGGRSSRCQESAYEGTKEPGRTRPGSPQKNTPPS
jgi:hypothetical protein